MYLQIDSAVLDAEEGVVEIEVMEVAVSNKTC